MSQDKSRQSYKTQICFNILGEMLEHWIEIQMKPGRRHCKVKLCQSYKMTTFPKWVHGDRVGHSLIRESSVVPQVKSHVMKESAETWPWDHHVPGVYDRLFLEVRLLRSKTETQLGEFWSRFVPDCFGRLTLTADAARSYDWSVSRVFDQRFGSHTAADICCSPH